MFDKEYVFRGKHAMMVKKLAAKLSDEVGSGFFATNYDIYRLAPIIGWVYNRKADIDKGEESTKIFGDKILNEKDEMIFNYRVLMLLENSKKTDQEKIDIAFKLDNDDEARKEYDKLYNSYVLGGVEEMYERIFADSDSIDGYIMNLQEFIEDLQVRLYGADAVDI